MFKEHPLRAELAAELHARPHGIARAPAEVSHLAVHNGETAKQADLDHLTALCRHFKIAPPAKDATLFACDMGALPAEMGTPYGVFGIHFYCRAAFRTAI